MGVDCEICCICKCAELRGYYCSSRVQNDSDSDDSDSDDGESCHGFFCRSCCNGEGVRYCPSCEFDIKCKEDVDKYSILELVNYIKDLKIEYNNMLPIVECFKKAKEDLTMYREILRLKRKKGKK